ncbi:hypothetical protein RhiirA5_412083 [Rhizophagus irregularis]|uniref:Uncharacterized protein n=1 Tax=Rhizophagus irregularis TaxID=588596 RepID=A0A2I1ETE4_9GLOM|nr:hypothetical protein RhiirA5_412083 [Rhizophagus irregularis]PKC62471.1 hypothetical protein RhiirA1_465109 [Rhizophagus irregularis]PKY25406.1 hypothetical protein RhiirB3_440324 [Rhizophagus irregularis]
MKILTEFSEEEDEEIGVNEDVNSKSDDACDIYINDYDNHIISEHPYKCKEPGCEKNYTQWSTTSNEMDVLNNSSSTSSTLYHNDYVKSGDSDIEYNKNEDDNVGTKNHACILYNKKPMNAGKLVVEENFLQNPYFKKRSVIYAVILNAENDSHNKAI